MSSITYERTPEQALRLIEEVLNDFWSYGFDGDLIRITVSPEFKKLLDEATLPVSFGEGKTEKVAQVIEVLEGEYGRLEIAVDE